MSSCEKCWHDAQAVNLPYSVVVMQRRLDPCSPEEQAGAQAGKCPTCERMTLHQHTDECMACCPVGKSGQ